MSCTVVILFIVGEKIQNGMHFPQYVSPVEALLASGKKKSMNSINLTASTLVTVHTVSVCVCLHMRTDAELPVFRQVTHAGASQTC